MSQMPFSTDMLVLNYLGSRFVRKSRWSFIRRRRFSSLLFFVVCVGCFLVFRYNHLNGDAPPLPCLQGRFEAGEAALMPDILGWTKRQLRAILTIDAGRRSSDQSKLPCIDESGRVCKPSNCSSTLPTDVKARIYGLMFEPEMMLTMKYIIRIQCFGDNVPVHDVIIATAAESNQFVDLMEWVEHATTWTMPELKTSSMDIGLVVVNLGLTREQVKLVRQQCADCRIVTFPFWSFPNHVTMDSLCSSWRPIVIRALLARSRHFLVFADPHVRIQPGQATPLLKKAMTSEVLFLPPLPIPFPVNTKPEIFNFFKVDSCAFSTFPEVQLTFGVFQNTSFVNRVLVEPLTSCALLKDCVCPLSFWDMVSFPCSADPTNNMRQCHRYDQSVLNILLAKIFHYDVNRVWLPQGQRQVAVLNKSSGATMPKDLDPASDSISYTNLTSEDIVDLDHS